MRLSRQNVWLFMGGMSILYIISLILNIFTYSCLQKNDEYSLQNPKNLLNDMSRTTKRQNHRMAEDETCSSLMRRIHEMNSCYRNHDPKCAAPLYNWAYYKDQGFGRIIEHGTRTCLFAFALNRPCVVDVEPRDPYYTLRSFINIGTYDWDARVARTDNAMDAISKLPRKNMGHWESPLINYEDVLPMTRNKDWGSNATRFMEYWDGTNTFTRRKILLSPNWGTSWFPRIKMPELHPNCENDHLWTLLQNAMFSPTPLALHLHHKRREDVVNNTKAYGGIHLRTEFHKDRTSEEWSDVLSHCLQLYPSISKWWLIADNLSLATNITDSLPKISHGYNTKYKYHNADINNPNAFELFKHEKMALRIQDWMVLHESVLAIVSGGAFGNTGARGNGKFKISECGENLEVWRKE